MTTSDELAAYRIVIQYCFEGDLTRLQTKREMETINDTNMCPGHWYTLGTISLRIVGVVSHWKNRVVDRQKRWTSYVKTAV